jgi:cystathionine beta-lyase/cystathionine gamma-synthase
MWSNQSTYRDQQLGDTDDALIRLSVGIETTDDLLEDFERALLNTSTSE